LVFTPQKDFFFLSSLSRSMFFFPDSPTFLLLRANPSFFFFFRPDPRAGVSLFLRFLWDLILRLFPLFPCHLLRDLLFYSALSPPTSASGPFPLRLGASFSFWWPAAGTGLLRPLSRLVFGGLRAGFFFCYSLLFLLKFRFPVFFTLKHLFVFSPFPFGVFDLPVLL